MENFKYSKVRGSLGVDLALRVGSVLLLRRIALGWVALGRIAHLRLWISISRLSLWLVPLLHLVILLRLVMLDMLFYNNLFHNFFFNFLLFIIRSRFPCKVVTANNAANKDKSSYNHWCN